ncbi:MAG: hypothetical protein JWL81_2244 [Verrucomicrobiales bacterium]|nr:hypothetical protein [Verrucomicrobiales bacterium]
MKPRPPIRPLLFLPWLLLAAACPGRGQSPAEATPTAPVILEGSPFQATDTLKSDAEPLPDAAACLAGLRWTPDKFQVTANASAADSDWLLRFPSAVPTGIAENDSVALEWFVHRDSEGRAAKAPAMVVIHESGRGMVAGRLFARGLRLMGCHTFLIHLPGYGARTSAMSGDMKRLFPGLRQAIADARRARDAVASLPQVDAGNIGICGISLGGFVTSTVLGLDHAYDRGFILLAGGNLEDVIFKGERDAASLRRQLKAAAIPDDDVRSAVRTIEPLRLAHRADPDKVWLFSASRDEVVPPACSAAFVAAARLAPDHHAAYPAGHYSAALYMPLMIRRIGELMLNLPPLQDPDISSPVPNSDIPPSK